MNYHQLKQWLFNNFLYGEQGGEKPPKRYGQSVVYSLVTPNTSKVWGVDISHWNRPPVDLKRMKDLYGMSFVIIKGHDGTIKSNYFEQHVQAAREAGLIWFIYDWLYPNSKVSIDAQTTAWANQYKTYPDCSGVKIDAEWTFYAGKAANPSAADLRLAHDKFYTKSNKRAETYTAKGYADQYLIGFDWSREELWAAHYGVNVPSLPSGALTYIFHQFTSTLDGKLLDPKGNAELDGNYFNGNKEQFAARYGPVSEPPPGDDDMITLEQWAQLVNSLNGIRASIDSIAANLGGTTPPPVEPPPPATGDGYTGPSLGIYKVLDLPDMQSGNAITTIQDSYGNEITVVMDKMVSWMAANCPGWANFVKNGSVTQGPDGLWRYEIKLIKGQLVRIAEVGGKTKDNPLGNGRIVGVDSESTPDRCAVNMANISPTLTPYYFHKITGQPWYFPIIQPRQQKQMTVPNSWWIPMKWLEKVS